MKHKLIRITTIPLSLEKLLEHQLRFMKQYYDVTAISSDKPRLKKVGEKEGVCTYAIEMSRQITPINDLRALWKLYKFLKREKPLIVHTHTPKAGIVGMLASKLAGIPIRLHTVAGLPLMESTGGKRKLLNLVEKLTYSCATNVYPNSHGLKDIILAENFCAEKKLKVIGVGSSNGIDTTYFNSQNYQSQELNELRRLLTIKDSDFVFVFVGRLVGDKGINELVQAFNTNSRHHNHSKLLLVGSFEPDLDPLSTETMNRLSNNQNIISVGYKSDIRPYLAISNALVFPSYREGFPNVVMQAGAMGIPSIVSNINGCNEIIVDGINGRIIPTKNVEALTEAMNEIISNKELRDSFQSKAREMIVSRYDQKVIWNAILIEYKKLERDV